MPVGRDGGPMIYRFTGIHGPEGCGAAETMLPKAAASARQGREESRSSLLASILAFAHTLRRLLSHCFMAVHCTRILIDVRAATRSQLPAHGLIRSVRPER